MAFDNKNTWVAFEAGKRERDAGDDNELSNDIEQ
jgi:hypothetical protein